MKKASRFNFAPKTLKAKLLVTSLVSAGAALLIAGVVLAAYDYRELRKALVADTRTYADIVAENSQAAVSFGDPNDASQILASLRAEPHVVGAEIYDISGKKLAVYFREGPVSLHEFAPMGWREYRFAGDSLVVSSPVELNGRMLGRVLVQSDLDELTQRARGYGIVFGLVLLGALGAAMLVSRRLQRAIVGPVEHLSKTARTITIDRN